MHGPIQFASLPKSLSPIQIRVIPAIIHPASSSSSSAAVRSMSSLFEAGDLRIHFEDANCMYPTFIPLCLDRTESAERESEDGQRMTKIGEYPIYLNPPDFETPLRYPPLFEIDWKAHERRIQSLEERLAESSDLLLEAGKKVLDPRHRLLLFSLRQNQSLLLPQAGLLRYVLDLEKMDFSEMGSNALDLIFKAKGQEEKLRRLVELHWLRRDPPNFEDIAGAATDVGLSFTIEGLRRLEAAAACLRIGLAAHPEAPMLHDVLARVELARGRFQEAEFVTRQAIQMFEQMIGDPDIPFLHATRAHCALLLGLPSVCQREMELAGRSPCHAASSTDGDNSARWICRAVSHLCLGEFISALIRCWPFFSLVKSKCPETCQILRPLVFMNAVRVLDMPFSSVLKEIHRKWIWNTPKFAPLPSPSVVELMFEPMIIASLERNNRTEFVRRFRDEAKAIGLPGLDGSGISSCLFDVLQGTQKRGELDSYGFRSRMRDDLSFCDVVVVIVETERI